MRGIRELFRPRGKHRRVVPECYAHVEDLRSLPRLERAYWLRVLEQSAKVAARD